MPTTIAQVGAELAEVPISQLITNVAQGIADGQRALDLASIQTLIALSNTMVDLIPEVTEVITPSPFQVQVSGQAPVEITGARVMASAAAPVAMSALQAGIVPSFYQFTEATIALKMSVQIREAQEEDDEGTRRPIFLLYGSSVNFKTQNTYSYSADASSSITVVMKPIPAPSRLVPSTITVNALGPSPTVTVTP
ncbi:MAG TPA: hypothetical protein VMW38_02655 [Terriglobia bacterium]|nr:hypothetical protein [Terriglobia bacterium]